MRGVMPAESLEEIGPDEVPGYVDAEEYDPPDELMPHVGKPALGAVREQQARERAGARLRSTPAPKLEVFAGHVGRKLDIVDIATVAAEVDAEPAPTWLLRSVWPEDAYGVLAMVDKAGKSFMELDCAVSVASGTPWLGIYPTDRPGPVLVFYGEGSRRRIVRRLRAICAARGLELEQLPIRLCTRVPHLADADHLDEIKAELAAHPAVLVIVDPLYLAARGARGSDLYEMGMHLERVQHICQRACSALMFVTHYNKTGVGKGAQRITGVGPGAWGRVLATGHIEHQHTEPNGATVVVLALQFIGDEIPETTIRIRRTIWADDPDDLASPLHYLVELVDDPPDEESADGLPPAARRVLAALNTSEHVSLLVREIGDHLAGDGRPLKARTIQDALKALEERGLIDHHNGGPGTPGRWWSVERMASQ